MAWLPALPSLLLRLAFELSTIDDCYMKKRWFQVSIKGILVVALVIAAYLAGRTPWERAAKSSNAKALVLDRENGRVSLYAAVWREIALEYRDDIRESGLEWDKQSAKRFGGGGSYVGSRNSEEIRPRAKRWKLALSRDVGMATKQLESLKSLVVCVWDDPARIERWDIPSAQFCEINENEQLERWLIMAGGEELFALLPDSVFNDEPRFVLLAIPNEVENLLAMMEHQQFKKGNVTIQEVATTTFGFVASGESLEPRVKNQTLKSAR